MKNFISFVALAVCSAICCAQGYTHRVVVEEETGTGCQNCPYGIAAMEKLEKKFGDQFIGIALHWYNTGDPMYLDKGSYGPVTFKAAPHVRIERGEELHAYDGSNENKGIISDVEPVVKKTVYSGVEVEGVWNADKSKVTVTATIETSLTNAMFDVEFVLTCDSLVGNTQLWKQKNTFYDFSWSFWFDGDESKRDMERFCQGGALGQQYFPYHFDHVAIASSYANSVNQLDHVIVENGTPQTISYTLSLPTSTTLRAAIRPEKVAIIAMIVDTQTKKIVNAAKAAISEQTGVEGLEINPELVPGSFSLVSGSYSLSGQRVSDTYRGIVIQNGKKYLQH